MEKINRIKWMHDVSTIMTKLIRCMRTISEEVSTTNGEMGKFESKEGDGRTNSTNRTDACYTNQ